MKVAVDPSLPLSRVYRDAPEPPEREDRREPRREDTEHQVAWQRVIDYTLVEWGRDPSVLEDDGLPAPSRETIHLACRVAKYYRDFGAPAPQRVCPDTSGGIVFELGRGQILETLRITPNGTVELVVFDDGRLRSRTRLL
jgi:hypothetical protein